MKIGCCASDYGGNMLDLKEKVSIKITLDIYVWFGGILQKKKKKGRYYLLSKRCLKCTYLKQLLAKFPVLKYSFFPLQLCKSVGKKKCLPQKREFCN